MTALFCNGEGMRGGSVHANLDGQPFLGAATTAARYRFFSVRDEFPGVVDVGPEQGGAVRGELYDVELRTLLDRFLPGEPAELELGVVELDDGRAVLGMVLRPEERERHLDITAYGGWREYRRWKLWRLVVRSRPEVATVSCRPLLEALYEPFRPQGARRLPIIVVMGRGVSGADLERASRAAQALLVLARGLT